MENLDICRDYVTDPPSAQMLQQPKVSYLNELLGATTLEESSITAASSPYPQAVAHGTTEVPPPSRRRLCPGSPIFVRDPPDWYLTFYIRTDLWGSFHTYPDLGGPFKSLQEADNAIDRHLHDLEDPKMCKDSLDKLTLMECAIRKSLYWPDGTMRKQSEPLAIGDVLHHQFFISEGQMNDHFNFTTETKGADGLDCAIDNLFFAEVKFIQGERKEEVVSCICIVTTNDNGHCYGCKNNGKVDMKHPSKADAYSGGHVDGYVPCGGLHIQPSDFVLPEEERLRFIYKGLDDPCFLKKIFPNCVIPAGEDKKHAGVED